jgi:hypothetical protein
MTLAQRIRANAALLDMIVRRPGHPPAKRFLGSLVADLLRQAAEAELLERQVIQTQKEAA